MKILQVIDIPWYSGTAAYAMELSKGFSKKGHKVFFAAVRGGLPEKAAKENGFETIYVGHRHNPWIFSTVCKLSKFIKEKGIDIVNTHTGKAHFIAYFAKVLCGRKFVLIRTKSDNMMPKKSFVFAKTDVVIAASELIRKRCIDSGIPADKVVTIPQGIEINALKSVNRVSSSEFRIGIVARLDPVKGHEYFIEAAAMVAKEMPDVKFIIAGKEVNVKQAELRDMSEKLGISKYVEFKGHVENVQEFMDGCDIGVISSTGSEVVSRVLLEWMERGKPVVSTNVGCIPEILPDEYLVPPRDPEKLAELMLSLLKNKNKMVKAGLDNRKIIEWKYNMEKFVSDTEKIYNENIAH